MVETSWVGARTVCDVGSALLETVKVSIRVPQTVVRRDAEDGKDAVGPLDERLLVA